MGREYKHLRPSAWGGCSKCLTQSPKLITLYDVWLPPLLATMNLFLQWSGARALVWLGDPLWCLRTGEGTHWNGHKKKHFTKIRAWTDDSMKDLLAASQDRLFGEPVVPHHHYSDDQYWWTSQLVPDKRWINKIVFKSGHCSITFSIFFSIFNFLYNYIRRGLFIQNDWWTWVSLV